MQYVLVAKDTIYCTLHTSTVTKCRSVCVSALTRRVSMRDSYEVLSVPIRCHSLLNGNLIFYMIMQLIHACIMLCLYPGNSLKNILIVYFLEIYESGYELMIPSTILQKIECIIIHSVLGQKSTLHMIL